MSDSTVRDPERPSLSALFERLVDESGDLLKSERRVAEAKLVRRLHMAALPLGLLSAAAALGLIALMALATAIIVMLGPAIGFLPAVLIVLVLAAVGSFWLFAEGSKRLPAVWEMPAPRLNLDVKHDARD